MLSRRVVTALIFAPALLYLTWLGGLPFEIVCVAISMLMLGEFLQLTLGPGERHTKAVAYVLGIWAAAALLGWLPSLIGIVFPAGVMFLFVGILTRPLPLERSVVRAAFVALGVAYTMGLLPFLAVLRDVPDIGLGLSCVALFSTWAADTGAYFTGKGLGRHKLSPSVSPGKTVEGAIGGIVAAVGISFFIRWLFDVELATAHTAALGLVAAVFGLIGDLCESMLKRSVGAKDSSALIPGHGGVLDRFDAVLFASPAVYLYATLVL